MTKNEVMQMALDALQENCRSDKSDLAIEALHAALAQQNSSSNISSNSEPVASVTISHYKGLSNRDMDYWGSLPEGTHQLYTAPPQRKPLTDEQVDSLWQTTDTGDAELDGRSFARAIEAAHGIKEES